MYKLETPRLSCRDWLNDDGALTPSDTISKETAQMEYADEPRLVFLPLSPEDYVDFYNLEMDSFDDDVAFYATFIHHHSNVLELGCGSGRLTRLLAPKCRWITGVDNSPEMLGQAQHEKHENITFLPGNMAKLKLDQRYDCIIIPYNTLNLLNPKNLTEKCLRTCRHHLKENGSLLFQVFHPTSIMIQSAGEKLFQFIILKRNNGDTIIKETIKRYSIKDEVLELVERYRDRPLVSQKPQRDLEHKLELYAPRKRKWEQILKNCGFKFEHCFGSYALEPFIEVKDSILFIHASPLS